MAENNLFPCRSERGEGSTQNMIVLTCTQEKDEHKAKLFVYAHEEKRIHISSQSHVTAGMNSSTILHWQDSCAPYIQPALLNRTLSLSAVLMMFSKGVGYKYNHWSNWLSDCIRYLLTHTGHTTLQLSLFLTLGIDNNILNNQDNTGLGLSCLHLPLPS